MECKYNILSDNLFGDKSLLSGVIDKEKLSQYIKYGQLQNFLEQRNSHASRKKFIILITHLSNF